MKQVALCRRIITVEIPVPDDCDLDDAFDEEWDGKTGERVPGNLRRD